MSCFLSFITYYLSLPSRSILLVKCNKKKKKKKKKKNQISYFKFPPPKASDMATAQRRGPSAGPTIFNGSVHSQNNGRRIVAQGSNAVSSASSAARANAKAIAAIHERMRLENSGPTIAELALPSGRQPKNGGMSTKQIVAERLRQRKAREEGQQKQQQQQQQQQHEEKSVADTLAWVRAKSAERRSKRLLEQFDGKENKNSPPNDVQPSLTVAQSIARGQAVLQDADAHMSRFQKYMSSMASGSAAAFEQESDGQHQPDEQVASALQARAPVKAVAPKSAVTVVGSQLTSSSTPCSPKPAATAAGSSSAAQRDDEPKASRSNSSSNLVYQKLSTVPFEPVQLNVKVSERLSEAFNKAVPSVNFDCSSGEDEGGDDGALKEDRLTTEKPVMGLVSGTPPQHHGSSSPQPQSPVIPPQSPISQGKRSALDHLLLLASVIQAFPSLTTLTNLPRITAL